MLSRLARSVLAAATSAALLFMAPVTSSAAPAKSAAADAKKDDAKSAAKAGKGDDAKGDKSAKSDDAKSAKGDKKAKDKADKDAAKGDKKAKDKADKDAAKDDAKLAKADKKAKDKDDAKLAKADKKAKDKDDAKVAKADKKAKDKDDAKVAKADKKAKDKADKDDAKDVKGTASIGAPNKGRLQGAVKLHSSKGLKLREHAHGWALPQLAKLLQRAAGKVTKHFPRSVMLVGDLSAKTGGPLVGHNSHQSGRDADVAFYVANSKGQPAAMTRFVAFDGQGKSAQVSWAQFDDARNWALVEALLTDKEATVRYIFVSNPLRARVLAYARSKKVAKDLLTKAETVLMAPRDADVHDDHFHVRIACPESMKGHCIEESNAKSNTLPPAPIAAGSSPAPIAAGSSAPAKTDDAKTDDAKPATSDEPKPAPVADAKTAP